MTEIQTSEHDSGSCPSCDAPFDAVTTAPGNDRAIPKPGDVSVCPYCAYVGMYDDDLRVVKIPRELTTRILSDPGVQALAAYWRRHALPRPAPCPTCHGEIRDLVDAGSCRGGDNPCGGCLGCVGPCPTCGTTGVAP